MSLPERSRPTWRRKDTLGPGTSVKKPSFSLTGTFSPHPSLSKKQLAVLPLLTSPWSEVCG